MSDLYLIINLPKTLEFIDYKNIFATDDGYVRLHFTPHSDIQKETYEWSEMEDAPNDTKVQPIIEASKAKGFLDYKALLHTHYLHYASNTVNVFDLLIENLLANVINDRTGQSISEEWQNISEQIPLAPTHDVETFEAQIDTFNIGLSDQLESLQTKASEILQKFGGESAFVQLDFGFQGIENDYKACAIYVRTAFEAAIKRYCEKKNLAIKYRENPRDLRSEDFWAPIKTEKDETGLPLLDLRVVDEIERSRKFILNELSHATFANIYRKELEDAIEAVEQLENALA